ncbi:hypothetical protein AB0I10_07340 [Streptomyces sp. NPDC050636]|uniref:hypothetical protein n=1 Tax=Streptomyces sp. NPDC050636 TaxID=3154510 RepID=UPI00341915E4
MKRRITVSALALSAVVLGSGAAGAATLASASAPNSAPATAVDGHQLKGSGKALLKLFGKIFDGPGSDVVKGGAKAVDIDNMKSDDDAAQTEDPAPEREIFDLDGDSPTAPADSESEPVVFPADDEPEREIFDLDGDRAPDPVSDFSR